AMRSTDTRDLTMGFFGGRAGTANVYGGYTDAAGDPGKYFSHLSYANYFNPQHNPFVTWSLLKSFEQNGALLTSAGVAIQSEISWGSDFLVRSLDAAGYFYIGVFDDWGGSSNRQICEWSGSGGTRSANYQCAFREGAGMAIAALAKTAALSISGGTFTYQQCLQAATTAYAHLKSPGTGYATKNLEYCNDHTENIIDDYTRLLAATELYKATKNSIYLADAQAAANNILAKQNAAGWLYTDAALTRPFYHGVDEGLPVTALAEFLAIDNSNAAAIKTFFGKWLTWYAAITKEVYNPYNYVRAYAAPYTTSQQAARKGFFMPHNNETGYWWQGENARLGSMSAAFMNIARSLNSQYTIGTDSLSALAISQVDWIMGSNPFNTCFMFGVGQTNYPNYPASQPRNNMVGGICNGITSKDSDENDIDWKPFADTDWQNWRWIEQWLPHNAWYLVNASQMAYLNNTPPATSPGVSANFGFTTNQLTVSFTNSSTGANVYTWSMSSAPGLAGTFVSGNNFSVNPIFTYTTSGNYLVCLTATSSVTGTSSSLCKTLTVCQTPVLITNPSGTLSNCGTTLLNVNTSSGWTYQWQVNGANIPSAINSSYLASTSGIYTVSVTSFGCNTVSGNIALTINTAPGSLSAISGKTILCPGELANYSVSGLNLASIAYTWTIPSGWSVISGQGNNAISLITGSTSGIIGVTASNACGTSPASLATLTINPAVSPSLQIESSANNICSGTGVSFTATGINAGTFPSYTWKVNGSNAGSGTVLNYIPKQGDVVSASLIVGGTLPACISNTQASSTGITMTVNGINTSSVSIASSNTVVCAGTGVSLTATGVNAGSNPLIRWQVNGSFLGTGSTFTYIPSPGDNVLAIQTVGGILPNCLGNPVATSNGISLTVNAIPPAPSISGSAISYCQGASASPLTASGTGLLWYTNSVGGIGNTTAFTPNTAAQGTINYYVSQTIASCESPRATLTSIVYPIPSAPSVSSPVNLCQGITATALTASGSNLQWYLLSSGGTSTSSVIPSTSSTGSTSYF
ncbi:MAG: glycoside hydrolase family 9 protein, partial [Cytophagales bacterium]|nr:glycoside hydrolase family 9 protein [Cytophagales bacterium]